MSCLNVYPNIVSPSDDTGDDAQPGEKDTATPIYNPTWRHYNIATSVDLIIIGSFGAITDTQLVTIIYCTYISVINIVLKCLLRSFLRN